MGTRTNIMWALVAGLLLLPAAAPPASAQEEGIKVHGDWVIEVRNPDGSIAARHEFQNALVGNDLLVSLLLKRIELRGFSLGLHTPQSGTMLIGQPGNRAAQNGAVATSTNLEARSFALPYSPSRLELVGSVVAPAIEGGQWQVSRVSSFLHYDMVISGNVQEQAQGLTSKSLTEPIVVLAGQIVQVTVRIGFS